MSASHLTRSDLEALLPEPILTVEEVAGRLRRHPLTVVRAIKRGALEAIDGLGRPYLVTRSAVIAWALGAGPAAVAPTEDVEDVGPPRTPGPVPAGRAVSQRALDRRRAMAPKRRVA